MPIPFGFSVGDFVSVINLTTKLIRALKDVGGASNEYQYAFIEVEGLNTVMEALIITVDKGHDDTFARLSDQYLPKTAIPPTGNNLLHLAARQGYTRIARICLSRGFDVNSIGYLDQTPLFKACTGKYWECALLLYEHGGKIKSRLTGYDGILQDQLHWDVAKAKWATIEINGEDKNARQ
ncbi:hypothetical protein LTR84_005913 [Exophiala bonariae]|uniref:Uncharacterized protein n=1 Tax=Exophiala bonariae TaxID=1690606 RepID=A0AAV9N5T1_9EURO|nr:hypothetical protein LTR84_005913 [Exophiala bonariae]